MHNAMEYDLFDLIAGCGSLWITDGIWKTVFPHCMFRVEVSYNIIIIATPKG